MVFSISHADGCMNLSVIYRKLNPNYKLLDKILWANEFIHEEKYY